MILNSRGIVQYTCRWSGSQSEKWRARVIFQRMTLRESSSWAVERCPRAAAVAG